LKDTNKSNENKQNKKSPPETASLKIFPQRNASPKWFHVHFHNQQQKN
jgi:hypothetical protein